MKPQVLNIPRSACRRRAGRSGWAWARAISCLALAGLLPGALLRADDTTLVEREEAAVRAAVARVAPSVVSIETVGGLERAGSVLFGTGATTGLIVTHDGYIVSSAFNFAQKPTSILVGLPDGTRTPARLVAQDRNRMLVLLKVDVEDRLTAPEIAPRDEVSVGQWAIAVGRTFEKTEPNMSVGIVSALNRIWGKALQTDAKVSPANYGGPLVDIRGRVLGVLAPMSPTPGAPSDVAGVEWYDSGIGFAIPLDHVFKVLPALQTGKDLLPGILGISLKRETVAGDPPVISLCRPNSPAYKAGFKPGDRIIEIDGQPIERHSQLLEQVYQRYAGDSMTLVALRDDQRISKTVELIDRLDPYQRAMLGLLPARDPAEQPGVVVRYVFENSPAAAAGLQAGDRIVAVDGQPVESREALLALSNGWEIGQQLRFTVAHGNEQREVPLATMAETEEVPANLPPAHKPLDQPNPDGKTLGSFTVKIPGLQNEAIAFVPGNYDASRGCGLMIWLHAKGGFDSDALVDRWRELCEDNHLILLAPKAGDANTWQRTDVEFIVKAAQELLGDYRIDPTRIVAHGADEGAAVAYELAFSQRELVRGVAAVNAPVGGRPPENDPVLRLAFHITVGQKARFANQVEERVAQLRNLKYPVTLHRQPDQGRYYNNEELAEMLRWLDIRDRL